MIQHLCDESARLLEGADGLVISAGAGMGVDSGLPDFRGNAGLWRAYPALAGARLAFEEIASTDAFVRTPTLAWGFYGHRLNLYRRTVPHRGFAILQAIGARLPRGSFVFTSNVVQTLFEDNGPGIPDVPRAIQDAFSTGGGLGAGLTGTKRMMDKFGIESRPGLTRVSIAMIRHRV